MRFWSGLMCLLLFAVLVPGAAAQNESVSCEERVEALEQEARDKLEGADSEEEAAALEEKYIEMIEEAEEECREEESREKTENDKNAVSEDSIPEDCREKALGVRKNFIDRLKQTPILEQREVVGDFMRRTGDILSECGVRERPESDGEPGEKYVGEFNLSVDLPERTSEKCSGEVEEMKEVYRQRMENASPEEKRRLADDYFSSVEEELESCEQPALREEEGGDGLKLVDVSEAPEGVSEDCKDRMRGLNKEIRQKVNSTGNASAVKEEYRERYRSAMMSCMTDQVTGRIVDRISDRLSGALGGNDSQGRSRAGNREDIIEEKNRKIERLQERVSELENRLDSVEKDNEDPENREEEQQENLGGDGEGTSEQADEGERTNRIRNETGVENRNDLELEEKSSKRSRGVVRRIIDSVF